MEKKKFSPYTEIFSVEPQKTPVGFHELNSVPYGATPLDPYKVGVRHSESNDSMRGRLRKLITSPPDDFLISPEIIEIVNNDFDAGIAARETRNSDAYWQWLTLHEQQFRDLMAVKDNFWLDLMDRLNTGHASVSDGINLMRHSSLRSITLASLTMPWGYRADQYPKMITAAEDAISEHNGKIYEKDERGVYRFGDFARHYHMEQVAGTKDYDKMSVQKSWAEQKKLTNDIRFEQGDLQALLVTFKRKIGYFSTDRDDTPEATCEVRERLSAVIVCDELHDFPSAWRAALRGDASSAQCQLALSAMKNAITTGTADGYLFPLSSCIYAARTERESRADEKAIIDVMSRYATAFALSGHGPTRN